MRWTIYTLILFIFIGLLGYFFYIGSKDFETDSLIQQECTFASQGDEIAATLFIPKRGLKPNTPVAILIHGDGPQNRTSNAGYLPLINHLTDMGIAVFSWDKKGIGMSKGNWLNQSLQDRAIEAKNAFHYLVTEQHIAPNNIGYLGFSQAGWVIPKAARITQPAFSVIIGGAVNWMDQGAYYTATRLTLEGKIPTTQIQHLVDSIQQRDYTQFKTYNDSIINQSGIDKDRFLFIARNLHADATADIENMNGPLLALWGKEDLNVPADHNAQLYKDITNHRIQASSIVKVYPKATHGLLLANYFNYQLDAQWPEYKKWLFVYMGRKAYAKNVLSDITSFIKSNTIDSIKSY